MKKFLLFILLTNIWLINSYASITVTYPNGGENFYIGKTRIISWADTGIVAVNVDYSSDNGVTWTNLVTNLPNTGSYTWVVNVASSLQSLIKVSDAANLADFDVSDNVFYVDNPFITVLNPNGLEVLRAGTSYNIKWDSQGVNKVKLEYSLNNTSWIFIDSTTNTGLYSWVVPLISSATVKIRITDLEDSTVTDKSDNNFRITNPAISVTAPNGGENLRGGTSYDITWTSVDIDKVKIEYTTDNGLNWITIADSASDAAKKYTWILPEITNNNIKVRVSKHNEFTISDVSDNIFRIYVPSVTVTSPNTNVSWLAGSNQLITWTSNDITNLIISYSTDNGANWISIDNNYPAASGSYLWTVPFTLSDNCLVKLTKADEISIFDISDTNFRIYKPSIQLIAPNGGENWRVDSVAAIKWISHDVANVKLEYTTNDGATWTVISFSEPDAPKQYMWQIPNVISNNVKVRVSKADEITINDESDASFRIYKPTLTLNIPNGGEEWRVNTNNDITFTSTDVANVNIEYTTNNGSTWLPIVSSLPAAPQKYTWNVNISPSINVRVKVSKADEPTLNDISDLPFTVYQPSVTLLSPNGGELLRVNSNKQITWTRDHVDLVKLEYTTDNGANWYLIKDSVNAILGSYTWTIPNVSSSNCKVKISKVGEAGIYDVSDAVFTIYEPYLSLVSPDGGEKWRVGTTQNITWNQSFVSNIKIEYSTNNGVEWIIIQNNYPATAKVNSYQWTIPNTVSDNCKVKISKSDEPTLKDSSSNVFTIYQKVLTLTRPVGGEQFEVGTTENITWTSAYVNKVKIEYTKNNGLDWILLDSVNASLGSYAWIVPNDVTNNGKIRISDNNELTINQTSPNPFIIFKRSLNILSPNGGETWRIGTQKTITWESNYVPGNIKIDYSIDNGANWLVVTPSVLASLGAYEWTVPNTASTNCLIRITSNDYPYVKDISSGTFTIYNPSIAVVYPNGGERLRVGNVYNILWQNNFVNNVKIEYSTNNGADWITIANSVAGSLQSYAWTVPNTVSQNCKIKISDVLEPAINDVSNDVFEIYKPYITVIDPNGGELLRAGTTKVIKWNSYLVTGDSVKIELYNGSSWSLIATNIVGSIGQYNWVVPNILSTKCKIKISKVTESSIFDESDLPFTIYYPYVNLISPNGGEAWRVGRQETIKWRSGYTNNLNIEYSTNGGVDWLPIANNVVNTDTTYIWTIPNTESENCKVRVYDNSAPALGDTSANNFEIYLPFVKVTRPNGGERFKVGVIENITWSSKRVNAVNILYSTDNGVTFTPIVNSVGSVGSYNWLVPDKASKNCVIMIRNADEPTMFDYSDAVFEIYKPAVTVVSPNGGERWRMGTNQNITWVSNDINNVKIEFSTDDGLTYPTVITPSVNASLSSYSWVVPVDTVDYNNCKIRISDATSMEYKDESDSRFSIYTPKLIVTAPNGGEKFRVGSNQIIRWEASNVPNIKIEYSTDNGVSWILITAITSGNSLAYGWNVPNTVSKQCRIKITDISETTFYDVSDNIFEIYQPAINVVSPNGGEIYQAGSTKNITWTSNDIDNVKIELSTNNGTNWVLITASTVADSGLFVWEIPTTISSTQCRVKISSVNEETLNDVSDGVFTIFKPVLAVISPNGNENWRSGSEQVIKWTSTNIENVKLEYTTNNGISWITINQSVTASISSYKWIIPVTPSNNCRVRISDVTNENINDISDNTFVIYHPTLTLLSPAGGEKYKAGNKKNITWDYTSVNNVKLEYSTNGGVSWKIINANTPAESRSYQWIVEDFPSTNCYIKISDVSEPTLKDSNDTPFTIYHPNITVTSPVKNDYWRSGTKHEITWLSNDVNTVKIEYTTDNGESWDPVDLNVLASAGKYNWTVPYISNAVSDSCKIKITDLDDPLVIGYSQNTFTIYEPNIVVKSPNGGEFYRVGSQQAITWKSNDVANVKIELSINGGTEWETVVSSISAASGLYLWTVPNRESQNCRIKISDVLETQTNDISNNNFGIYAANIKITSPNANSAWRVGDLATVTWTSNNVNKVKIELTTNDSTNWTQLITGLNASEGKYTLQVPNTPSTTCRVRVSDASSSQVFSISELFKIFSSNLVVKVPNGGEAWRAGSKKIIVWESSNISKVDIDYTTNNGATWVNIVKNVDALINNYEWTIPNDISSNTCKIRVSNSDAANVYDVSNSVFSINKANITITSPIGGENWRRGTNHYITWQGNYLSSVNIDYSTNDGVTWLPIVTGVSSVANAYVWVVPNTLSENCRVKVSDSEDPNLYSVSPAKFTISESGIKLVKPNGGEYLRVGTNYLITWECSDIAAVNLEFSIDGGTGWLPIANNVVANNKSYNWTLPTALTSKACKVRVVDANYISAFDVSDSLFTIYKPGIKLIKPNGGEEYQVNVFNEIEWESNDIENIKIEVTTNNGASWNTIISSAVAANKKYAWFTNNYPSDACKVKVSSYTDPTVNDISDNKFKIFRYPTNIKIENTFTFGDVEDVTNYKIIGLPGNNNLPLGQVIPGTYKEDWKAFYDNGQNKNYYEEYDGSDKFTFKPGNAFWIISRNSFTVSNTVPTKPISDSNFTTIPVRPGWNLISNPFELPVNWSKVTALNNITINAVIYSYNGGWIYPNLEMRPFVGYAFYNATNKTELKIPYSTLSLSNNNLFKHSLSDLEIILKNNKDTLSTAYININNKYTNSLDEGDLLAPPSEFCKADVRLINNNLGFSYNELFKESRPLDEAGMIFELKTKNLTGNNLNLSFNNNINDNWEIYLLDCRVNELYDIKNDNAVNIPKYYKENNYKLLIGSKEFIENIKSSIIPNEYKLYQNYPNPFNAGTVIRYSLPVTSMVKITIYDLLGKEVKELQNEKVEEGYHELFVEMNDKASGVYFVMLSAKSLDGGKYYTETKKIMLLK